MNELTVVESATNIVSNIGSTIMSMASMVKRCGVVNKKASIILAEELRMLKYECRNKGYYHLVAMTIEHMDQINRKIEQNNHSGRMREMDIGLLELLYEKLYRNIEEYANENQ